MHGLPVGTISLAGAALFAWPFLGTGLPDSTPAWVLMIACVAALLFVELGTRQLDSRAIALLAAIAAIDTALRLAVIVGIGGFNPIFFLVLCAGFVFGPSFGFLGGRRRWVRSLGALPNVRTGLGRRGGGNRGSMAPRQSGLASGRVAGGSGRRDGLRLRSADDHHGLDPVHAGQPDSRVGARDCPRYRAGSLCELLHAHVIWL